MQFPVTITYQFQSTLPRRERRHPLRRLVMRFLGFNPRSREGSDSAFVMQCVDEKIVSIHAPAKGATCVGSGIAFCISVSIHAPAKGATVSAHSYTHSNRFQSTLPRRERRKSTAVYDKVRGFNPRSREGSDTFHNCYIVVRKQFQSTLPRRERRC